MTNRNGHSGLGNIAPQLVNLLLGVFVVGWLLSIGAEIFKSDYTAPTGLNETMIALVTAFFVAQQRLTAKPPDPPAQQAPPAQAPPAPPAAPQPSPPPAVPPTSTQNEANDE